MFENQVWFGFIVRDTLLILTNVAIKCEYLALLYKYCKILPDMQQV